MGVFLKEFGFSLLLPPKCGSTSLKSFIFELENGRPFQMFKHNGKPTYAHDLYPTRPFEDLKKNVIAGGVTMCVVRNPVDRVVSCHSNRVMGHGELDSPGLTPAQIERGMTARPSLENFVTYLDGYRNVSNSIKHHAAPLSRYLGRDAAFYDFIFDISEMDRLVAKIGELVGGNVPALANLQTLGQQYKPKEIAPALRAKIEADFAEDFDIFGAYMKAPRVA